MIDAFDRMTELFLEKELFSGVVLLARDGKPVYQKACGPANRMGHTKNTMETRFATASVTKMFTAVAIVQLIMEGKLRWDSSVVDYLDLGEVAIPRSVTVMQLLTHTSGIADYTDDDDPMGFENLWRAIGPCAVDTPAKLLPFFMDEAPIQAPGVGFDYSNAGYILLGLILERASGLSYDEVIRRRVFKKSEMHHSDFISLAQVTDHLAEGYIPIRNGDNVLVGWERNIFSVPAYGLPDGGAYSTAGDLICFMRALRSGVLLDKRYTDLILKPVIQVDKNWKYGCGIWFDVESDRIIRYGHTGEDPGISARVYYYPIFNMDLVILGNQSYCAGDLDWQFHHILMEEAIALAGNNNYR